MRRAARIDANQPQIVGALRDVGALVEPLHMVGGGFPDILVYFRGQIYLLEIKDGAKPPSERKLTRDEAAWHARWVGAAAVVASVEEALRAIGAIE